MKIITAVTLWLFVGGAIAQSPIQAASGAITPTTALPAPTPVEEMKKSVVLLETDCYVVNTDGTKEIGQDGRPKLMGYAGTAFLLSMPDQRLPANSGFTYLVTNHHVAAPGIEDGKPCIVAQYVLRFDTKTADAHGSYITAAVLPSAGLKWVYPADASIDLAITPISAEWDKIDLIAVPSTLLLSDADVKENRVEEGDSVTFTGVFVQLVGQTHSEPIVREGKIAMMPAEPVPTTLRKRGDIYLVDCHVFGGNSGSPMFVNLAGQRYNGLTTGFKFRLLGVVSGYMTEGAKFDLQTVASYAGTVAANSGVAIIVPAQKVLDLLQDTELKAQRDAAVSYVK